MIASKNNSSHFILSTMRDAVVMINDLGNVVFCNDQAITLLGYSYNEMLNKPLNDYLNQSDDNQAFLKTQNLLTKTGTDPFINKLTEALVVHQSGRLIPVEVSMGSQKQNGHWYAVATLRQTSDGRQSFELQRNQLNHVTTCDQLTGLPNQILLRDRLQQAVQYTKRHSQHGALILFGISNLSSINDTYGHKIGDQLIQSVAKRLQLKNREYDTIARYTGKTFGIIITELKQPCGELFIQERFSHVFDKAYDISGHILQLEYCAGVSLFSKRECMVDELLHQADIARHYDNTSQVSPIHIFSDEMDNNLRALVKLKDDLHQAVKANQFVLFYQPKLSLRTGHIISAEALIRWQHPERGLLSPYFFIEYAEKIGLIPIIGEWVIQETARQQKTWKDKGISIIPVGVNVSAQQFTDSNLAQIFKQAIIDNDLEGENFDLELTESVMLSDPEITRRTLEEVAKLGISISIDDYGTGYSTLSYLQNYPISKLKIDRSFITHITQNPHDAVIVRSTLSMCHSLGIEVIAEGVENKAQLTYLIEQECDEMQGFLFSPPVPADEFAAMLIDSHHLDVSKYYQQYGNSRTLVLLDDEENILSGIKRLLHKYDYDVYATTSPQEAMDLIALHQAAVVISDQKMPGLSGVEFLSMVRKLHPQTVRMVLSGHTDHTILIDAINQGAVFRVLTKPVKPELLLQNINDAFQQYALSSRKSNLEDRLVRMRREANLEIPSTLILDVEIIDKEHRQLFDMYNQLLDYYYLNWNNPEELDQILTTLEDHAKNHFEHEEEMMKTMAYTDTIVHQQQHEHLYKSLNDIILQWRQHPQSTNFIEMCSFLRHWLLEHVREHDIPFAKAWKKFQNLD